MANNLMLLSENLYPPSTYPTTTDLSTKFGYGAKLSSGLAILCTSQGERPLGVIRASTSSTDAHGVEVVSTPGMQVACIAGTNGITNAGDEVTNAGTGGAWESAGSGDVVIGYADRAAADGEEFICNLTHFYVK